MFNLFQKKLNDKLDEAEKLGLITTEEKLRLRVERATRELEKHLKKDEGRKPKKK